MKKVAMLSAAVLLAISSMAASQAEEATDTSVDAAQVADTAADTQDAQAADGAEADNKQENAEPIPEDTPQVKKLIAKYPNLVARIKPYGVVCFQGQECDVTITASGPSADGQPRDGEAVYNAVCHTCHAAGLLGSPKFGDKAAWAPRIAKGKDTLHKHAIEGFNAMPAKGGVDIPDEEVINAVDYMVSKSS